MAQTTSFYIPTGNYFIRRFQWQVHALGNDCACELLSVLMFHFDYPSNNRLMTELTTNACRKRGGRIIETAKWLPYSASYLRELLLQGHSPNSIKKGLQILIDKGFVSDEVPEHITKFYSNNMNWYQVNVNTINSWLVANYPIMNVQEVGLTNGVNSTPKTRLNQHGESAKAIGEYFKHIFNKSTGYLLDSSRLNPIKIQLKNGRPFNECVQSVAGFTFVKWYQENDKVELKWIFKDSDAVDRFIREAEKNEITSEIALSDYENFQQGKPSSYMLVNKVVHKGKIVGKDLTMEMKLHCKGFAREIYAYLQSQSKAELLSLVRNDNFTKYRNILDADYLTVVIVIAITTYSSIKVTQELQLKIEQFSNDFCKYNQLNHH